MFFLALTLIGQYHVHVEEKKHLARVVVVSIVFVGLKMDLKRNYKSIKYLVYPENNSLTSSWTHNQNWRQVSHLYVLQVLWKPGIWKSVMWAVGIR